MIFVAQAVAAMTLLGFFVAAWVRFSSPRRQLVPGQVRVAPQLPPAAGDISLGGVEISRRAPSA